MMFSKACEYGIKATIYIALKSKQDIRVSLLDIAREIDSPVAFTAKVLQKLTRNKIIDSIKGPSGGFEITKSNFKKITLARIVFVIDGNSIYKGCGLGFKSCNPNKPCPVHNQFTSIRENLKSMLESTSLNDLLEDLNNGTTFLK